MLRLGKIKLLTFQKKFIREATAAGIRTAALSLPRGNGKSFLAGLLCARALTPKDPLFVSGHESVLCASSIQQARIVYRYARDILKQQKNANEYSFIDNSLRVQIRHRPSSTKLIAHGSNGRSAMGLANCPLAICDEPSCWEVRGGELMWDALTTARGKPNSSLRVIFIGTLAPATDGWYADLIASGSSGDTYIQVLQADKEKWDNLTEIKRVNPLTRVSKDFYNCLQGELKKAKKESRNRAQFLSYRLNIPTADEASMLLSVDDWDLATARSVPPRQGRPIVGVDLGAGRSWSAAVAMYQNGRVECLAIAPGIPSIAEQERRDSVRRGTYQNIIDSGTLTIATGKRVPPVQLLVDKMKQWNPARVVCDRFRHAELLDCEGLKNCTVEARVSRWSEAAADIRALRTMTCDGNLAPTKESRRLLSAALSVATVKNDEQGNCRLVKLGQANMKARDDCAAALVLCAGAAARAHTEKKQSRRLLRVV